MPGSGGKGKVSGNAMPASVFAEIPDYPRIEFPRIREKGLQGKDSARLGGQGNLTRSVGGVSPQYVMEFSDGQQVKVAGRCLAGRVAPADEAGLEAYVVLDDVSRQVSRSHFEFGVTPQGQVWVMDCGSANGTWLVSAGERSRLPERSAVLFHIDDMLVLGDFRAWLREM